MKKATLLLAIVIAGAGKFALPQDRLPLMPGYDRYTRMLAQGRSAVQGGRLVVRWSEDGKAIYYRKGGKGYRLDLATRKEVEGEPPESASTQPPQQRFRRRFPERGRQFTEAFTPDGGKRAFYRDGNVWMDTPAGPRQLTQGGDLAKRIKYGTASWTYGEELGQRDAMGWSPDGKYLWYYRFNEQKVPDYYLAVDALSIQDSLYAEPYVKAGGVNPTVDLFIQQVDTGKEVAVDVRDRRPFDEGLGHYVYAIDWSPDGRELLFHRTNRLQNENEFMAADPATGKVRVIVREQWKQSWVDNAPQRIYLDLDPAAKGKSALVGKMLWLSERTGYRQIYLLDLKSGQTTAVTKGEYEIERIARVDAARNQLYYIAYDGDSPYKSQLHRVGLDGKNDRRLTEPTFNHDVSISPDGRYFVDVRQTGSIPPSTVLLDVNGSPLKTLATSDASGEKALGLRPAEVFTYTAADGKTKLWGKLQFPSNFDSSRKYPLLVFLYAGPESGGISESYEQPEAVAELGFLVASFGSRGGSNRGKAFKDEVYMKLGTVEIDDQAAGVRELAKRPYVDGTRVGVQGVSYGGYAAIMCLLRYPGVFKAAIGCSSVTDWRNYDSIYTERYMRTPAENQAGYDAGSAMSYVGQLKGRLLLYFGTADDNVHPSNTYQLVRALQRAGKGYDMQIGPDIGHSGMSAERMWEFFLDWLGPAK